MIADFQFVFIDEALKVVTIVEVTGADLSVSRLYFVQFVPPC